MATKINYTKLNDGTWGAFVPSSLGKVVIGEDLIVTRRDGEQNWHTVATIVEVTRGGTIVTFEKEEVETTEVVVEATAVNVETELKKDNTMLNITELKAKAASNDMSIVDVRDGLYQIYSGDNKIGGATTLEHLQAADIYGVFDDFEEVEIEPQFSPIEFLCTNGSNSSFRVEAVNADVALLLAIKRFDSESDYVLPINVESECGLTGACIDSTDDEIVYTDDELGLNDDYI